MSVNVLLKDPLKTALSQIFNDLIICGFSWKQEMYTMILVLNIYSDICILRIFKMDNITMCSVPFLHSNYVGLSK